MKLTLSILQQISRTTIFQMYRTAHITFNSIVDQQQLTCFSMILIEFSLSILQQISYGNNYADKIIVNSELSILQQISNVQFVIEFQKVEKVLSILQQISVPTKGTQRTISCLRFQFYSRLANKRNNAVSITIIKLSILQQISEYCYCHS